MRHMIRTLLLMITVGLGAFVAGWNAHRAPGLHAATGFHTEEPVVVLTETRMSQKPAPRQNEGCEVPNGVGQHKSNERDGSIMKGLVF